MHRLYFYLAAFISITTIPVSSLAETATDLTPAADDGGFYIDLPAVNSSQLIDLIRAYQASLAHREQEITRYLEENRLDAKDVLITVILPGGLLYAAVRKANLEQAKGELAEMTEDMDELSRDLLAMQAVAGELTVAQLQ